MIIFEGIAVCLGVLLFLSHLVERMPVQRGVLLGIAAGLGFGISDVAIKALSGDLDSGPVGPPQPLERGYRHGGGLLVLRLRSQSPDRRRRRGDRRHLGRGEPLHDPRRAGGPRRSARRRRPGGRRAHRGVRPDPRRGSADPSARSRRRGARGVSRGAQDPNCESRPQPNFRSRTKDADRWPLAVIQSRGRWSSAPGSVLGGDVLVWPRAGADSLVACVRRQVGTRPHDRPAITARPVPCGNDPRQGVNGGEWVPTDRSVSAARTRSWPTARIEHEGRQGLQRVAYEGRGHAAAGEHRPHAQTRKAGRTGAGAATAGRPDQGRISPRTARSLTAAARRCG
jgi:hypothetical protein